MQLGSTPQAHVDVMTEAIIQSFMTQLESSDLTTIMARTGGDIRYNMGAILGVAVSRNFMPNA